MFDKLLDSKFFGKSTGLVVIFVIVCLGLYVYSDRYNVIDKFSSNNGAYSTDSPTSIESSSPASVPDTLKTTTQPNELLPNDVNSDWAKLNPVGTNNVVGSDLLDSKAFMGQISQFKGIMNHDIRAFPVIEKKEVSPWMQSTYEADITRTGIQCTN